MKHEEIILQQPQLLLNGIEAAKPVAVSGQFDQVIVCGMGGSALPGEFLKFLIPVLDVKIPVHLSRNYSLPYQTSDKALVVAISHSGNTEETLAAYNDSLKRKLTTVAISTGGNLEILAEKNKTPFVKIANNPPIAPRFALFPMLGVLLQVLANAALIKSQALQDLTEAAMKIETAAKKTQGQALAQFLSGKIILVYASHRYKALATNWKLKLNESAQIPCYTAFFSELNHNEIAGFSNNILGSAFAVVIMKGPDEYPVIEKRMSLTAELLKEKGLPVTFVEMNETNIWERVLQNSLLGDWLALTLAEHYGVDPASSEIIESFKKRLGV